ncbi:3331_t:CDS:1, partial [Cetraspora pellucida]
IYHATHIPLFVSKVGKSHSLTPPLESKQHASIKLLIVQPQGVLRGQHGGIAQVEGVGEMHSVWMR